MAEPTLKSTCRKCSSTANAVLDHNPHIPENATQSFTDGCPNCTKNWEDTAEYFYDKDGHEVHVNCPTCGTEVMGEECGWCRNDGTELDGVFDGSMRDHRLYRPPCGVGRIYLWLVRPVHTEKI